MEIHVGAGGPPASRKEKGIGEKRSRSTLHGGSSFELPCQQLARTSHVLQAGQSGAQTCWSRMLLQVGNSNRVSHVAGLMLLV